MILILGDTLHIYIYIYVCVYIYIYIYIYIYTCVCVCMKESNRIYDEKEANRKYIFMRF